MFIETERFLFYKHIPPSLSLALARLPIVRILNDAVRCAV